FRCSVLVSVCLNITFRGFNLYKYMYMLGIVCHGKGSTCRKEIRLICEVYACASNRRNVKFILPKHRKICITMDKLIKQVNGMNRRPIAHLYRDAVSWNFVFTI
uniref:Uncharacterized protein n=1 Tax=Paramormyrops kingsleyae TaxID=1676925 RepID=A0A3B3QS18_9TELE